MKLYYVTTFGDYFIIAESDDGCTCTWDAFDFQNEDKAPRNNGFTDAEREGDRETITKLAENFLTEIAYYNNFDCLYGDWTAGEPEGFPHPPVDEILDDTCDVVATVVSGG